MYVINCSTKIILIDEMSKQVNMKYYCHDVLPNCQRLVQIIIIIFFNNFLNCMLIKLDEFVNSLTLSSIMDKLEDSNLII